MHHALTRNQFFHRQLAVNRLRRSGCSGDLMDIVFLSSCSEGEQHCVFFSSGSEGELPKEKHTR